MTDIQAQAPFQRCKYSMHFIELPLIYTGVQVLAGRAAAAEQDKWWGNREAAARLENNSVLKGEI